MHWSLRQHACVVKLELECPPMCFCEIWIWLGLTTHRGDRGGTVHFSRCSPGLGHHSHVSAETVNFTRCAEVDGAALAVVRRRKERTYPELVGDSQRAKLVVLVGEIGGRFSEETHTFIRLLARFAPSQSRCAFVFANLGCSDWGLFWFVPLPGRLRLRCWIVGTTWGQTAPPRRMLKFWLISAGRH